MRIPIYKPSLGEREKKYVLDCIDSTWISSRGKYVELFEERFRDYVGTAYAVTAVNGTSALHLALLSVGVGPGDEVIVPTLTYIASVNAVTYTGATPVFADSLRDTWQISPAEIERKITERTKAVVVVHLYGHPCDMDKIMKIANEHGIAVVEDCCEAVGARYGDKHVGTFGTVGVFSFYGNKTLTTGEGGMVVTDDEGVMERVRHFRGQGQAKGRIYWHDVVGYNYRMTNICAAIGVAQLERVEEIVRRKRELAVKYRELLPLDLVEFHEEAEGVVHSYWMVSILVDEEVRDELMRFLGDRGVETRPLFPLVHRMPMYRGLPSSSDEFPFASELSARGINLPSYPDLSEREIEYVCGAVREFFGRR